MWTFLQKAILTWTLKFYLTWLDKLRQIIKCTNKTYWEAWNFQSQNIDKNILWRMEIIVLISSLISYFRWNKKTLLVLYDNNFVIKVFEWYFFEKYQQKTFIPGKLLRIKRGKVIRTIFMRIIFIYHFHFLPPTSWNVNHNFCLMLHNFNNDLDYSNIWSREIIDFVNHFKEILTVYYAIFYFWIS